MKLQFFKILFLLLLSSFSAVVYSQEIKQKYPFDKWKQSEIDAANSAKTSDYLSKDEKSVIFYSNLARINGKLFAQTYLQKFIDSTKQKKTIYVNSLFSTLKNQSALKPLVPSKEVSLIAKQYAIKMGKEGFTGHKDVTKRFAVLKTSFSSRGENCDYGYSDPLTIVMDLLIDDGVSGYGHRNNILDKEYNFIGVSIQPHKKYATCCVMDFVCQ
ncbi:MAG: CAP domain-containing protein [Bacteroidetes bacterium]|nr:CAP domain-containing protein [Bacteroidota bacterium]